jgi:hypothetical protein
MSVSNPAGRNMKNTPARKSACDGVGIDRQKSYRLDHGFVPAMATSIVGLSGRLVSGAVTAPTLSIARREPHVLDSHGSAVDFAAITSISETSDPVCQRMVVVTRPSGGWSALSA